MSQAMQTVWLSPTATEVFEHVLHWGFLPEESVATSRDFQVIETLKRRLLIEYDTRNLGYRPTNFARSIRWHKAWGCVKIPRKYYLGGFVGPT